MGVSRGGKGGGAPLEIPDWKTKLAPSTPDNLIKLNCKRYSQIYMSKVYILIKILQKFIINCKSMSNGKKSL